MNKEIYNKLNKILEKNKNVIFNLNELNENLKEIINYTQDINFNTLKEYVNDNEINKFDNTIQRIENIESLIEKLVNKKSNFDIESRVRNILKEIDNNEKDKG